MQTRILRSFSRDKSWLGLESRFRPDLGNEFAVARGRMVIGREAPIEPVTIPPPQAAAEVQTFLPGNLRGRRHRRIHVSSSTACPRWSPPMSAARRTSSPPALFDDGISVFSLSATGVLTNITNVTDDAAFEFDGARGLSTAMVDGNTYLFVAGQADDGVSVFRVNTNGSLTNVSNVTDNATMLLAGVSDTATAQVGAFTYLYTAGTTENGISIFRVAGDGRLTYLSNHVDAGALELAGVRAMTTSRSAPPPS